jgi:hypothetical protein
MQFLKRELKEKISLLKIRYIIRPRQLGLFLYSKFFRESVLQYLVKVKLPLNYWRMLLFKLTQLTFLEVRGFDL